MSYSSNPPSRRQFWITQLIAVVCFIVMPVLVTALLQASWISLNRDAEGRVSATSRTCVLFVVPWRAQQVAEVTGVDSKSIRSDRLVRHRSRGHDSYNKGRIHSDGESELTVQGKENGLTVKISPDSEVEVKAKVQAFLDDPSQSHQRLFVIANWKFGLGFGIPLTLLALLYIVGSSIATLRAVFRRLRKPAYHAHQPIFKS